MKRFLGYLFVFLVAISVGMILIRLSGKFFPSALGFQTRSGIKITSNPVSTVFINDAEVGKTPYLNEQLNEGSYQVKLISKDATPWSESIKLMGGTITVINRELTDQLTSSSGETLELTSGQGVEVVSDPDGANLEVDGKPVGTTPQTLADLPPGDHEFLLLKDGYLKRNIKASLPEGLKLTIRVDLAFSDSEELKVDLTLPTDVIKLKVINTPTGFLRVRATPSLTGREVTRVATGDELIHLEDSTGGWIKVKTDKGVEGFVLGTYTQKL